jgi:hypothetical protein
MASVFFFLGELMVRFCENDWSLAELVEASFSGIKHCPDHFDRLSDRVFWGSLSRSKRGGGVD